MAIYEKLPNDPVMLLSFLNTLLRDNYESLEELAAALGLDADEITAKMRAIDCEYDAAQNRFL